MPDRRVECGVEDAPLVVDIEDEANAFRILPEAGDAFFLDFIKYYPEDHRGQVVMRIRLQRESVSLVRDRLANDMIEITGGDMSAIPQGMVH